MFSKCFSIPLVAVAGLLFFGNTSHAEDSKVTGRITFQGKPIEKGRIIFQLEDGQFVGATINDEGKYVVKSVPKGTRTVAIEGKGVPEKYNEKSSLIVSIAEGENNLDFDLK